MRLIANNNIIVDRKYLPILIADRISNLAQFTTFQYMYIILRFYSQFSRHYHRNIHPGFIVIPICTSSSIETSCVLYLTHQQDKFTSPQLRVTDTSTQHLCNGSCTIILNSQTYWSQVAKLLYTYHIADSR